MPQISDQSLKNTEKVAKKIQEIADYFSTPICPTLPNKVQKVVGENLHSKQVNLPENLHNIQVNLPSSEVQEIEINENTR